MTHKRHIWAVEIRPFCKPKEWKIENVFSTREEARELVKRYMFYVTDFHARIVQYVPAEPKKKMTEKIARKLLLDKARRLTW